MDTIKMKVNDETETDLVNLRRTVYLTIMSTLDFEEACHKLMKIKLNPGRQEEMQLCIIIIECCIQNKAYLPYYALLAQRFCMINKIHSQNFEKCFVRHYSLAHRLETSALINSARFFAHLIAFDALSWRVLAYLRLTEEDSTLSSRIFIMFLFQDLCEHLGLRRLNERLSDPKMKDAFESIFPRDSMRNTRFSINFFTAIGLGGITENLREWFGVMERRKRDSDSDEESETRGSESDARRRKRRRC